MPKKACCVITHCRNSSEKTASLGVTYQKFPLKEKIRRRWVRAIQSMFSDFSFDDSTTQRLCSEHFEDNSFMINKNGKEVLKLDAVPTIFNSPSVKKEKDAVSTRPRHQSRRAASKEALKQMQILLEDEDDAVEIPDEDYVYKGDVKEEPPPVPAAVVPPPKKKYKLSHRKSSDDREVLVLKSITPNITNHDVENNLELECWVEELEPCQKERNKKLEEENETLQAKLDELIKECNGEVIYKGDLTTVIEVAEHVQKTIQAVQASQNKPPIVLNSTVANPQPYQLVVDPRIGLIVGSVPSNTPTPAKSSKIQVAANLQAPVVTPSSQTIANRNRLSRTKKQTPVISTTTTPSAPLTPVNSRSVLAPKAINNKRSASQPPPQAPPATRSRGNDNPQPIAPTPPATRSRPGSSTTRPSESSVEGGLTTGLNVKPKAIVDLTTDDGRPLPDSREVSFNKLQGKTFPSLVVVARPHLRVSDVNSDRPKLDAKVKSVLMYIPTKFTEWLIQQGLIKSEQACSVHSSSQLKLGMYSDVTKFPYSGGYVWISECCPQRFVSVFSGSIFEGSQHPPLVILKILYHWACQTNIQNVTQWVKVENMYVKSMYTLLRSVCTLGLQMNIRKLGGPQTKVEVGVISLGTTSQDGNSRQVKVEVLGILECNSKLIRLRAIEPLADGERNYKKRFSKILEPLEQWVHPNSIIITDLTVDKATLNQMGFSNVMQPSSADATNSNKTVMDYLRRIVPRMFQNTLSLLSRQIIQQFLDELVWREWFGTTSLQAFENLITHLAEQTRFESNKSLVVRLNKVAVNPFRQWVIPPAVNSNISTPPAPSTAVPSKPAETLTKKRKRKDLEPPTKPTSTTSLELNRPPKSTSPDVPEQMVPLENYYYGTIDNYPPKTNVTLNLKCPFCKEVYNNNIVLMNHLFKHAHNVSKDGQMCRYCLTSVSTANDLLKHIGTAHPSDTKHDNGFACLICETQYMNPFVLGKHMSKEHCPSELPYQCGTCGYRCSNHKQAIDHFHKQHDNGPTIQCPFCLKSTTVFSSSRNIAQNMHYFIQHLQKHQKKQFAKRCGKCNLWFVQKEILKDHQMKMHASQRGKSGLVPWLAPRNGVMVPKSKIDKYPCDGEGINFGTLFYNVSKGLKCKECDGSMDSSKHFPSFESCQNPNCQYSTCCSKAMQDHNAKCNKNLQRIVSEEKLPHEMFCICGYSSQDGNQMAKHLATCEKKSAYPSLSDAKSASVTHSMLDVLGLVRKPEESDKKVSAPKSVKRSLRRSEAGTIGLDEDETSRDSIKSTRGRKCKKTLKVTEPEIIDLIDDGCSTAVDVSVSKASGTTDTDPVVDVKNDTTTLVDADEGSINIGIAKPIILEDESTDSSITTENHPVVDNEEDDGRSKTPTSTLEETENPLKTSDTENDSSTKDHDLEVEKECMLNQTDILQLTSTEEAKNFNEGLSQETTKNATEGNEETHDSKETMKDGMVSDISPAVDNILSYGTSIESTEIASSGKTGHVLCSDSLSIDKADDDTSSSHTNEGEDNAHSIEEEETSKQYDSKSAALDVIDNTTLLGKCSETSSWANQNDFKVKESSESTSDILGLSEQAQPKAHPDSLDHARMKTDINLQAQEPSSENSKHLEEACQELTALPVVGKAGAENRAQLDTFIDDPVTSMEVD